MIHAVRIGRGFRNLAAFGIGAAMFFLFAAVGDAKTWTVTTTEDSATDTGSLRCIISKADNGDTIRFSSGGSNITGLLVIDKKLTIEGPATIKQVGEYRIFSIYPNRSVTLRKLTLTGGGRSMERGGAVYNSGSLTMEDCTVTGNSSAKEGGGIFSEGKLTMKNCTVTGNSSSVAAGIMNRKTTYGAKLTLKNCVIERNTAHSHCGGVYNEGALEIDGGAIRNNIGGSAGDTGIYNAGGASAEIEDCEIANNTGWSGAGGLKNEGTLEMKGGSVSSNSGGSSGGIENTGSLKLKKCAITGNSGGCNGGGIYNNGASMTAEGCTITGNNAKYYGGGIFHLEVRSDPNPAEKCRLKDKTIVTGNGPDQVWGFYKADSTCTIGSAPNKSARSFTGFSGATEPEPRSIIGDADVAQVKNALADPASDLFATISNTISNDIGGASGDVTAVLSGVTASLYYANTFECVAVTSTDLVVEYTASYPERARYYAIFARADGSGGYELPTRGTQFELQAGGTLPDGVTPPDFFEEGEGLMTWRSVVADGGSYDLEPAAGVVTFRVCSVRAAEQAVGDTGSGGGCNAGASAAEGAPLALLLALPLLHFLNPGSNVPKGRERSR